MPWLRHISLARKFHYAFGIVCGLCILLGIFTFVTFRSIASKSAEVSENHFPSLIHISDIRDKVNTERRESLELMLCQTSACTSEHALKRQQAISGYRSALKDMEPLVIPAEREHYQSFIEALPVAPDTATGFVGVIRARHRYNAIVSPNRDLFRNARVLDIMGSDGLWSLAALDAGASRVVRVNPSPPEVVTKSDGMIKEQGFEADSYEVVSANAWRRFDPGAFDIILCQGILEESDPRRFFKDLHRLRPKHIVLDTEIVRGSGPIARFRLAASDKPVPGMAGRYATVIGSPSHELIMFLCDQFDFQWRRIDWHAMGISKWIGIHDYERDERRTYVLSRISQSEGEAT